MLSRLVITLLPRILVLIVFLVTSFGFSIYKLRRLQMETVSRLCLPIYLAFLGCCSSLLIYTPTWEDLPQPGGLPVVSPRERLHGTESLRFPFFQSHF